MRAFGFSVTPKGPAQVHPELQRLAEYLGVLAPPPPPPFHDHADVIAARLQATELVTKNGGNPEAMKGFIDTHVESVRVKVEAASKVTK